MAESKFTPGPWEVERHEVPHEFIPPTALFAIGKLSNDVRHRDQSSGELRPSMTTIIAQVPVVEANARLIAAAPELLYACKIGLALLASCIRSSMGGDLDLIEQHMQRHPTLKAMRTSIAKATGSAEALAAREERT